MTELHFLGPDGPLSTFPLNYELKRLREPNPRAYLDVFASAASLAQRRPWVLDLLLSSLSFRRNMNSPRATKSRAGRSGFVDGQAAGSGSGCSFLRARRAFA